MTRTETRPSNPETMSWITPPECQGQTIETQYARESDQDGYLWSRTIDHSAGPDAITYRCLGAAEDNEHPWEPWNEAPRFALLSEGIDVGDEITLDDGTTIPLEDAYERGDVVEDCDEETRYQIEHRTPGRQQEPWDVDLGGPNVFESREEAEAHIEELRNLDESWARAEYRVTEIQEEAR